jgi:hypothetical protein
MFCPNCATENSNLDVKFCRVCGKDLRLISQAMVKRIGWSTTLASKLDGFFMSKSQRSSREESRNGFGNILLGICLVGLGLWNIFTHDGVSAFTGFLFLTALLSLGIGVGNVWVHKRRLTSDAYKEAERLPDDLSIYKQNFAPAASKESLQSARATSEISGQAVAELVPPSVTEHTTISLKERGE